MTGPIILGITLAIFVGFGIWALTVGRKIKYPKNTHHYRDKVIGPGGWTCDLHIFTDKSAAYPDPDMIYYTLIGLSAVRKAWIEVMGNRVLHTFNEVAVWYTSGIPMKGVQGWLSPPVGRKGAFPILHIRPDFVPNAQRDPLIRHEMTHALADRMNIGAGGDNYHADPRLWRETGDQVNPASVEARAIEIYRELLSPKSEG